VVATCYLLGVSTRRMEKLVESLGITRLSKSQVSEMAKDLDAQVADFRHRPLDAGPYTFLAADALVLKVREGGRSIPRKSSVLTAVLPAGRGGGGCRRSFPGVDAPSVRRSSLPRGGPRRATELRSRVVVDGGARASAGAGHSGSRRVHASGGVRAALRTPAK
jgi:hypothetical protein